MTTTNYNAQRTPWRIPAPICSTATAPGARAGYLEVTGMQAQHVQNQPRGASCVRAAPPGRGQFRCASWCASIKRPRPPQNTPAHGRNLVRLRDLVGAPRGRTGLFFCLPGRGGHLGGPPTKWGGPGRPAGHAAVPPAVPR
jgi:hypothetical protein